MPWRVLLFSVLLGTLVGCRAAGPPRTLAAGHLFRPTARPVISSPIAYDFDRDGRLEIAVGSWDGYFYVMDDALRDQAGWPRASRRGFFASPALADLDGEGTPEIVVGSEAGKLFAWRFDGRDAPSFPIDLGYPIWASPTILPGPRIAIGDYERMWLFDARGQVVAGWPQPLHGWPDATAAYRSGRLAVATLTPKDPSQGWLYLWDEAGRLAPGFPVELAKDSDSSPALADLDGDGRLWMIFGDDAGELHVVDEEGRERSGFPVRTAGPAPDAPTPTPAPPGGNIYSIEASPALADLDGDSRLEIVVGSWDGNLYIWRDNGQAFPGWPIRARDQIISSAALVDLDGDERLDIVVGSKDGRLYGWTTRGQALPGFPFELGAAVFSSPWVGDLEGDGRADVVVGANNGVHLLRDVGPLGALAWPTFHQNAQRTGATP